MSGVILINPFEVPAGQEKQTLELWERVAEYMRRQPGYISTRLHRAITPEPKFLFINVAEWDSPEAFFRAAGTAEFQELTRGTVPHYPALYEVIRS